MKFRDRLAECFQYLNARYRQDVGCEEQLELVTNGLQRPAWVPGRNARKPFPTLRRIPKVCRVHGLQRRRAGLNQLIVHSVSVSAGQNRHDKSLAAQDATDVRLQRLDILPPHAKQREGKLLFALPMLGCGNSTVRSVHPVSQSPECNQSYRCSTL